MKLNHIDLPCDRHRGCMRVLREAFPVPVHIQQG